MRFHLPTLCLIFATTLGCEEGPPPGLQDLGPLGSSLPFDAATPEPEPDVCQAEILDPGPTLVRRLTRLEYDRTVRDLVGHDLGLALSSFTPEEEMLGFDNNARALQVTPVHAEQFMSGAEAISAAIVSGLADHLPCDAAEIGEITCAEAFIHTFGRRAWRRPLTEAEFSRLSALFAEAATMEGLPFETGIELVVQALLQSPHFIYRIEVGSPVAEDATLRALSPHEIAARLAYFLWRSMPDDALFDAADQGALGTAEAVGLQARRMLADPKAQAGLWTFFAQWLRVDEVGRIVRDARYYPEVTDAQKALLVAETRAFIDAVVWGPERDFRRLYDADFSFRNDALAAFYGEDPVGSDALIRVPLDTAQRRGVLTHASVLSVTSKPNMTSPVHRGVFVREHIFCEALAPPPPNVPVVPPDPDPNLTTRQRWAIHSQSEACAGCHRLIDPPGFLYENFDALGRWRAEENGHPVDATGTIVGSVDLDGPYDNAAHFAGTLANSAQAQRCVATQVFRYAFGRGETSVDRCTIDAMQATFTEQGFDFVALIEAATRTDAFRYRRAQGFEEVQ